MDEFDEEHTPEMDEEPIHCKICDASEKEVKLIFLEDEDGSHYWLCEHCWERSQLNEPFQELKKEVK